MQINYLRIEDEKISVDAYEAFWSEYNSLVSDEIPLNEISEAIKERVVQNSLNLYSKKPSTGSLNNCKGLWNELSFLYSAHFSILQWRDDLYLVKMGNENSIKFWQLYKPEARVRFMTFLDDLKRRDLVLRCSTPDFVLVRKNTVAQLIPDAQHTFERSAFDQLKVLYKSLIDQCKPEDVISFISLKTSNRPDRRYQILYEANVTKIASKYIHPESSPLQFHAVGTSNESDAEVFRAPFLPSLPYPIEGPVLDSDSEIKTRSDLNSFWSRF